MTLEERLREYDSLHGDMQADEEKLRRVIRRSEQALYESGLDVPMSGAAFLFRQAGYVRKRWWAAQGIVLMVLWWLLYAGGSAAYMQRCMGVLTPLFVILLMPELWKNQSSASMEIEGAAYFSIRKIYAARMLLFAMVDVLLLSVFFLAAAFTLKLTIAQIVIQFFLPLNVTCSICFQSLSSNRMGSGSAALAASLFWTAFWMLVVLREDVYRLISGPVWAAAVAFSVIYLVYTVRRVWKSCGQYWEVNLSWN